MALEVLNGLAGERPANDSLPSASVLGRNRLKKWCSRNGASQTTSGSTKESLALELIRRPPTHRSHRPPDPGVLDFALPTVYTVYMNLSFVFSQRDKRPMYQQIMEQIVQRITVGDWPPNTVLPSIRQLATEIKVSIITVKRAYLELEREGVIVTRQGKGSWVNGSVDLQNLQREELTQHLRRASSLAKSLGMTPDELLGLLKQNK